MNKASITFIGKAAKIIAIALLAGAFMYISMSAEYATVQNIYLEEKLVLTQEETKELYEYVLRAVKQPPLTPVPAMSVSVDVTFYNIMSFKTASLSVNSSGSLIYSNHSIYRVDEEFYHKLNAIAERFDYPMTD